MNLDLNIARQCLHFADRAYTEATISDAHTNTQVLTGGLLDDPSTLVVAFRGTREIRDFLTDARFIIKDEWKGEEDIQSRTPAVHRGFFKAYFSVAGRIHEKIQAIAPERILITGHSLGGALAQLCALDIWEHFLPPKQVITFGCPRVGNADFRDLYNDSLHDITLRYEAQGDPVPWSPPWLLNGYRHAGRSVYLRDSGEVVIDPPLISHAPAFASVIAQGVADLKQPTKEMALLFGPHALTNYARLLEKLA